MQEIVGLDEAGRGAWAGPACVAAVILPNDYDIDGLDDSKRLSPKRRAMLFDCIIDCAYAYAIVWVDLQAIERDNIAGACYMAMTRAVNSLSVPITHVLVDGHIAPQMPYQVDAIVGGDRKVPSIMAASILAKVSRDEHMIALDRRYPQYGFAQHKGYGTKLHQTALQKHGPCLIHRRTFAPIRAFYDLEKT